MLIKNEIQSEGIVHASTTIGQRASTYDATVGTILYEGKIVTSGTFTLEPRGVVWVISAEEIETKLNHTGLATLKTSWAHQGVFALNVGIIDPGWHGPIATALVNFSNESFELESGMPFLRLIFFRHSPTAATLNRQEMSSYSKDIRKKSKVFSKSFLNMHTLVKEIESEVFKLPKWAFYVAWFAIGISMLSIFTPIAYSVLVATQDQQAKLTLLQMRLDDLDARLKEAANEEKGIKSSREKNSKAADEIRSPAHQEEK